MTELVARHTEGARVTMRGMLDSATWPLRKLSWIIEEKVIWPLADVIRRRPGYRPSDSEYIPAQTDLTIPEPAVAAAEAEPFAVTASPAPASADSPSRRVSLPGLPRLRAPNRDFAVALTTIAVAVGAGIGIATLLGKEDTSSPMPPASGGAASAQSKPSIDNRAAESATLQGVEPDFKPAAEAKATTAAQAPAAAQASPTEATNSKPSAIPPGVAENITAMNTARDFAGAFVLYEVGKSNAAVSKAFTRTATPTLAKALQDRPPRLPESVQVPTAKVQNVVLAAPSGRNMEASVSLLRLGDLSELRLSLTRRQGEWLVSEVRG